MAVQPSIFRRVRLATFAFLALLSIGLVVSAALTVREQRLLRNAAAEIERLHEFQRVHVAVSQQVTDLGKDPAPDPEMRQDTAQKINLLIGLTVSPKTIEKLAAVRVRLELIDTGGAVHFAEGTALLADAERTEQQHQTTVLARLQRENIGQQQLELAAPIAVLAIGVLLLPLARRRIIKPLDAFAARLSRLAEGDFSPTPLGGVDPFLLPLHTQVNTVAARANSRCCSSTRRMATGELAASVAHELRNPLAGIQMTLSNLRTELGDGDHGERVDLVLNEVARLTRLLNSLLDSARHQPEPKRQVALAPLVEELLTLTRHQLPDTVRVESRVDPSLTARVSPDRLRQALLNLVLNAGGALGDAGGTIVIAARSGDERVQLSVTDDGPGFPAELLRNGIRPFFSTREQGTGLGLSLVRRFAREMGGDLTLANREPRGAEATLTLPVRDV